MDAVTRRSRIALNAVLCTRRPRPRQQVVRMIRSPIRPKLRHEAGFCLTRCIYKVSGQRRWCQRRAYLAGIVLGDEQEGRKSRRRPQAVRDAADHAPSSDQKHIPIHVGEMVRSRQRQPETACCNSREPSERSTPGQTPGADGLTDDFAAASRGGTQRRSGDRQLCLLYGGSAKCLSGPACSDAR